MRRRVLAGMLGALVMVGAAEQGVRMVEPLLPPASSWPTAELDIKYRQLRELDSAQVVFLGSSITEAAVDPSLLMREHEIGSAYNAAFPFSTPFSTEVWLERVVLPAVQEVEVVVIGIPTWSSGGEPEADLILGGIEDALEDLEVEERFGWSALVRNAGVLSEWDHRRARLALIRSGLITDLGHQTGYYDRASLSEGDAGLPFTESELTADEAAAIGHMLELLWERGIDSVVLIEPGRHPAQDPIEVEHYVASARRSLAPWSPTIWNSASIKWDTELFADPAHFNGEGTRVFTNYLAGLVAEELAAG